MKKLRPVLLLVLLLSFLLLLPCFGAEEEARIESVKVRDNLSGMVITASLPPDLVEEHRGELVYLLALSPSDIDHPDQPRRPVSVERAAERITFHVPLEPVSRLFSYFALAFQSAEDVYTTFGTGGFVSNPELLAENDEPYPTFPSKKGLQVQMASDAQLLGVSHTTLNIALDEFLLPEKTEGAFSFLYCGQTYYLDREKMELLDYRVRTLSEAGVNVIFDLLLTNKGVSSLPGFYYEGVTGKEAPLYAICLSDRECELFYEGFLRFLTERYTRPDRAYGFAGSYILGYEVNAAKYRNYMGQRPVTEYAAEYARLYRITDAAVRSVWSSARVYVPIANNFTLPSIDSTAEHDPNCEYTAKDFLAAFRASLSRFGSFPWRVSINAYPSDLTASDFRLDAFANTSDDSPIVSVKNIEVLCRFLSTPEMSFGGTGRHILIGEFGVSGKAGTESEQMQAALFAYAYRKILTESQIDAMIWHRHVDHAAENGLYFGLWTSAENELLAPGTKKTIWRVFRNIDTFLTPQTDSGLMKDLASLLGADSFDDLFPAAEPSRSLVEEIPLSSPIGKGYEKQTLFDFSEGDRTSFFLSDNAKYLEIRDDPEKKQRILFAELYPTDVCEYAGIGSVGASSFRLLPTSVLTVNLRLALPDGIADSPVMIRILGEKEDGTPCVFEGIGRAENGKWSEISFSLDKYAALTSLCTGIRIWVPGPGGTEPIGLSVGSITLSTKTGSSFLRVLLWISIALAILVAAALAVGIVLYLYQRKKRAEHRKRRAEAARARKASPPSVGQETPAARPHSTPSQTERTRTRRASKTASLRPPKDKNE